MKIQVWLFCVLSPKIKRSQKWSLDQLLIEIGWATEISLTFLVLSELILCFNYRPLPRVMVSCVRLARVLFLIFILYNSHVLPSYGVLHPYSSFRILFVFLLPSFLQPPCCASNSFSLLFLMLLIHPTTVQSLLDSFTVSPIHKHNVSFCHSWFIIKLFFLVHFLKAPSHCYSPLLHNPLYFV